MISIHRLANVLLLTLLALAATPALAQTTYTLSITRPGTGTGTVTSAPAGIDCGGTCGANFASGVNVTLTATPAAGHFFQGWSGWCSGTASTCALTMSSAKYATATFAPPTLPLTVSKQGTGAGTVTSAPAGINCGATCSASFSTNGNVTLIATPAAGSIFQSWSGCTSSNGNTCTVSINAAKTVYPTFAPAQFALTVNKTGTGTGTVTSAPAGINCGAVCSANMANGASVTLTAAADTGYLFQGWTGACAGLGNPCAVAMSAAKSVTATFGLPTTTFKYDANGNLTDLIDPLGNLRQLNYDALDRLYLVKEPSATTVGATAGQLTLGYDGQSQIASVKDPRNLPTAYTLDGLGNVLTLTSPDTGTSTFTYDEAGNLKTRLDARNKLTTYSYDALNRLTQASHGDQTVSYVWDSCTHGKGRLCQIIDGSGNTVFSYDAQGRLTGRSQTVGTVTLATAYAYNGAGQLTQLTTPAGQVIALDWSNGKVTALRVNGTTLISGLQYQPFGPVSAWTWGNGQTLTRSFDLAGRPRSLSLGRDPKTGTADSRALGYDGAGRIRSVIAATDPTLGQFHSYDGLDRLTGTQLGSPVTGTLGFGYDLTGNRTSQTVNGASTTYTTQTTSNRLTGLSGAQVKSFGYDAAGNLTADGATATYGYDNAGRRTTATINGQSWQYAYNGLGQRVRKTGPAGTTLYAYDEAGHLTGEYDGTGKLIQETVWLDDEPVATLRYPAGTTSGPASVFYVHADHLGTPRRVTRPSDNKVMWQWEAEPFGNSLPEQNPQGQGSFVYNLRFPGQVYDAETGLNQNYFRDYDPGTGRYVQSDPIGLAGGINTYTYGLNDPLRNTDPKGLDNPGMGPYGPGPSDGIWICNRAVSGFPFAGNHAYLWNGKTKKACSMRGSSGFGFNSENERGPGKDSCYWVPGSQGREDQVMTCCQKTANSGMWRPGTNDCHNAANFCLKQNGLDDPGAPGGRLGTCDSCNTYPNLEASGFGNLPAISF